ncbi:unnamed protein product [Urochloa humidicola]
MIETSAKPLPAPLLGAPSPAARRLAPDSSHALTPAAAVDAAPGQSGRAPTPRAPYEAPVSSSSSSSPALRASSQLSRWSRARALRSGRRLEVGLDRVAVSSAPPPQDKQPPALLHDDTPAVAVDDGGGGVCVAERDAAAGKAIYMVSDGTGWTAEHAVEAALGQFENCLVDRGCVVNTHLFSGVSIPPCLFTFPAFLRGGRG